MMDAHVHPFDTRFSSIFLCKSSDNHKIAHTPSSQGMQHDGVQQPRAAHNLPARMCEASTGEQPADGSALQQSYDELSRREQVIATKPQASYISRRRELVIFIAGACEGLGLGRHCIHQAICYLDRVCFQANVAPRHMINFAAACVLISSKMQDRLDDEPPLISHILAYDAAGTGTVSDVFACELAILGFLEWRVVVATAHDFAQAMIESGCLTEDVHGMGTDEEECMIKAKLGEFVLYFTDISVRESDFLEYKPSLIAGAAAAAARIQLQVTPVWPTSLQSLTGYSPDAVAGCSWLLSNIFEIERRCSAHDASPKAGESEENVSPTNVELDNYF